jgi:hypothetical protein
MSFSIVSVGYLVDSFCKKGARRSFGYINMLSDALIEAIVCPRLRNSEMGRQGLECFGVCGCSSGGRGKLEVLRWFIEVEKRKRC